MNSILILILTIFQVVTSQDISTLPSCGQYCVNEQSNIAVTNDHCQQNHPYCYCGRTNFQNQTIQCATQQCTNPTDLTVVEAWVQGYCANKNWGSKTDSASFSSSLTTPTSSNSIHITGGNYGDRVGIGAVVGISIGACVFSFSLFAALIWYCNRQNLSPSRQGGGNQVPWIRRRRRAPEVSELDLTGRGNGRRGDSTGQVHELHYATFEPKEMYVPPIIHELPAQRIDSPTPYPPSLPAALNASADDPGAIAQPLPDWSGEKTLPRRHGFDFSFSEETLPGEWYQNHLTPFGPSEATLNAHLRDDEDVAQQMLRPPLSRDTLVSEVSLESPLSPEEGGNGNGLLGAGLAGNVNVSSEHIPVSPLVERNDDRDFKDSKHGQH